MDWKMVGLGGLVGWRETVGRRAAKVLAVRTRLTEEQARALIGGVFFALSARYVVKTLLRARKGLRA